MQVKLRYNHKIFLIFVLSCIIVGCVSLNYDSSFSKIDTNEQQPEIPKPATLNAPLERDSKSADLFTDNFYSQSEFDNDWIIDDGEADVDIDASDYLYFRANDDFLFEDASVWNLNPLPLFSDVKIEYRLQVERDYYIQFDVQIFEGAQMRWQRSYDSDIGPTIENFDLPSSLNYKNNVRIRFDYEGYDAYDWVRIDYIKIIASNEFIVWELEGDPVASNQTQNCSVFIQPDFGDYDYWDQNNVYFRFKINNSDLTGASWIQADDLANGNYSCYIPSSSYTPKDEVYYQIRIQDKNTTPNYNFSDVFSFLVFDGEAPEIKGPPTGNYSNAVYHKDVSIKLLVNDSTNLGGSGISTLVMYCRNGSAAIEGENPVNPEGTVGADREYEFIIPSYFLKATVDLHYLIVAIDAESNRAEITGSFYVDDDLSPFVNFNDVSEDPVENNVSIYFYYTITEPIPASGLQDVELRIKVGSSTPSDESDYQYTGNRLTPINDTGGGFIFLVDEQYYNWSTETFAWCFVYAEDKSGRTTYTHSLAIQVNASDLNPPNVIEYPDNELNCSYHGDKNLIFEISEPIGAAGINSDDFCLYYQLNDPTLSSPSKINKSINKWYEIVTFTLEKTKYSLHDIVYFRINVSDNAGRVYPSTIRNFGVWDFKAPTLDLVYINDTTNDGVVMYYEDLEIKYEISEDDYGIGFDSNPSTLKFYYKIGSPPVSPSNYSKILHPSENIARRGGTYSILINHDEYIYGQYIYYWVNVSDIYGNHKDTYGNIRFFNISNVYTAIVSAPSGYINNKKVNISIQSSIACDIWYVLNGTNTSVPIFTNFYSEIVELDGDGVYNFIFYAYDTRSEHATGISFTLDTLPTGKVSLTYSLVGPIVEIRWEEPSGADSETKYLIYKSLNPDFDINELKPVETWIRTSDKVKDVYDGETKFIDDETAYGFTYYYKIVSVDRAGNISEPSDLLTASVPLDPMGYFVIAVAIIAAAAVGGFVVIKKIRFREAGPFYTDKELGIDDKIVFPEKEIKPTIEQKWDTIKTMKPKSVPSIAPPIMNKTMYWNSELAKLIQEGYEFESKGKYLEAIKTYQILVRISNRINGSDLAQVFQEKILTIYNKA